MDGTELLSLAAYLNRWMSEMYRGVRALWNATSKTFQLRNGKTIVPPKEFSERMPQASTDQLDGVLWLGYGKQHELSQRLSQNTRDDNLWNFVQYLVFDIPSSAQEWEARLAILKSLHMRPGWVLICKILTLQIHL